MRTSPATRAATRVVTAEVRGERIHVNQQLFSRSNRDNTCRARPDDGGDAFQLIEACARVVRHEHGPRAPHPRLRRGHPDHYSARRGVGGDRRDERGVASARDGRDCTPIEVGALQPEELDGQAGEQQAEDTHPVYLQGVDGSRIEQTF
jgi:hypothetical protein